jgi:hypothetical protein
MSEEKFLSIEETFTKKLKHAWDNGFENGKSSAIPWRKPEERPEVGRELILAEAHCDPEKKPVLSEGRVTQNGKVYLPYTECEHKLESFLCWLYADELPLPDWVQK